MFEKLPVFLRKILFACTVFLAGVLFLRILFIPLLPFLIALAFSAFADPWAQRLRLKLGVTRPFAIFVVTTALLLSLGLGLGTLIVRLGMELTNWTEQFRDVTADFPTLWNSTLDRAAQWYSDSPPLIRSTMDSLAHHLAEDAPSILGSVGEKVMTFLSALAAKVPDISLFLVTTVLAVYFTSFSYPSILTFLKRQLPPAWQQRCRQMARCCRSTLLKWLRAELLLILVTFLILLTGFWWMGLEYALLPATVAALVDALPVLGTGLILFPWAGLCLLLGQTERAIALVLLYAAVLLTHSLLEPRLLAGQADLPPITALLAMYLGFHFIGVGGMVLFPVLLLLLKQLSDAGVIRIWK